MPGYKGQPVESSCCQGEGAINGAIHTGFDVLMSTSTNGCPAGSDRNLLVSWVISAIYEIFSQPTYKKEFAHPFGKYQQDIPVGSCTLTPNLEEISTQHGTFGTCKGLFFVFLDGIHMAQ